MGSRTDLNALLMSFCPNVYFQEPESIKMKYPCVVYHRDDVQTQHADNRPYKHKTRYQLTVISREAEESDILAHVLVLTGCTYDRFFSTENLNHDVFTLFF